MANEIVLLYKDDQAAAQRIAGAFAAETGLAAEPHERSVSFAVHGREHEIKVVETLNRIDSDWSRYVSLGEPGVSGSGGA
ncbi:MAG TPA: hypothetical protein VG188_11340 [Solirubrobacteraceae bacterium]|nr:hypothetical protein [Solirubrobacteraceae bacterium]